MSQSILTEMNKPKKVKLPLKCSKKKRNIIIANEKVCFNNCKIIIKRLLKLEYNTELELNKLKIFKVQLETNNEILSTIKKKLINVTNSKNHLIVEYKGDLYIKKLERKLFSEIKGRIKLDDESLKFKDKVYEYWTKTKQENNYSIKLRRKIGSPDIEEYWNGDLEKKKLNTEYFGIGD